MKKKQFYTEPEAPADRTGIRTILENAKKAAKEPATVPKPDSKKRLHVSARGIGKNRKTIRKQLLFTPGTFSQAKAGAETAGLSVNTFIADRIENADRYTLKTSRMDSETKTRRVHIVLTEKQAAELAKRAQRAELSENAYIAALIRAEDVNS